MVLAWRADCRVVCLEFGTGNQTSRVTFSWVCPQLESDVTDTNASPHSLVIHARQLAREKRRAPLAWVSITAVLWQRQRHRRPRITLPSGVILMWCSVENARQTCIHIHSNVEISVAGILQEGKSFPASFGGVKGQHQNHCQG